MIFYIKLCKIMTYLVHILYTERWGDRYFDKYLDIELDEPKDETIKNQLNKEGYDILSPTILSYHRKGKRKQAICYYCCEKRRLEGLDDNEGHTPGQSEFHLSTCAKCIKNYKDKL